ncbi:MAG: AAA family ATPase [Planctomycetales bacterium]
MYTEYFQFSRRPFGATPDPACCYLGGSSIANVVADLLRCIDGGLGLAVVTGEAGTGKSLLCQYLATELRDRYETVLIPSCNFPTRRSLLQSALFELKQPFFGKTDLELRLELVSCLKSVSAEGRETLLILDEAHLLSDRLLEEVRTLADLSQGGKALLKILLAGQPSLEERLALPGHDALNHRIGTQITLEALSRSETLEYITCRLTAAGRKSADIFTPQALQLIARACDGLPRQINQLCDHALLLAYVAQTPQVDEEIVRQALDDLQQLPLHWNPTALSAGPLEGMPRQGERETIDLGPAFESEVVEDEVVADSVFELGEEVLEETESPDAAFEFGADLDEPSQIVGESSSAWIEESQILESLAKETPPNFPILSETPVKAPEPVLPYEERVEDRYASLDAGRPFHIRNVEPVQPVNEIPVPPETSEARPQHVPLRGPMSSAFFEHSSLAPLGSAPENVDPLQFLDEVVSPMLNRSLAQDLPTRSELDRRLEEFIAAQKSADFSPRSVSEIEEEIGEEVLDLCLETQQEVHNLEEIRGGSEMLSAPGMFETSTEEAVFEADDLGQMVRGDAAHNPIPRPNYKTVFSELRRRLKQKRML